MRENMGLFRGKRSDGEWVKGSLHIEWGETINDGHREKDYRILGMRGECYYVDPETVGECTGLRDKNDKLIFEGDIVKFCDIKGVINYSTGCYCVKTNKPDWRSRNNPAIDIVLNEYENELEIIGNIHDNPEFLKEGADNG